MRRDHRVGQVAQGMVERQRLLVVDVEAGAGDRALTERGHQRGLVDDRTARGVDQVGGRLHQAELARAEELARAVGEHEANAHHVRARQQLVLGHERRADLGRARGREVLAPRDHLHLEREADPGHARAQPAEPDDAERLAVQPEPAAHLPAALAGRAVFGGDAAEEREGEPPRQLGRRVGQPRGAAHRDLALAGRGHVDRRVAHARRHQELEPRQPLEERAGKRRALAHRDHRVEVSQPLGDRVRIAQMIGEDDDVGAGWQARPVGHATGDVLIVIEDRDSGHFEAPCCWVGPTPSNSPGNHLSQPAFSPDVVAPARRRLVALQAEGHGAEAELRDAKAGTAETNVPHACLPTGMDVSDARSRTILHSGASLECHRRARSIAGHRDPRDLRPPRRQPDHGDRHRGVDRVRVPHGLAVDHRRRPELREARRGARDVARVALPLADPHVLVGPALGRALPGLRRADARRRLIDRLAPADDRRVLVHLSDREGLAPAGRSPADGRLRRMASRAPRRSGLTPLDHHHGAEHLAVWLPAPLGEQEAMISRTRSDSSGRSTSGRAAGSACASTADPTGRRWPAWSGARSRVARDGAGEIPQAQQEGSVMLTPETIEATARAAFQTYTTRARYRPLDAAMRAAPLEDAYRIQDALHRVMAAAGRGEIAGWKIALTSKAMQQMTGVDQPAAGAVFSKLVHASPARVDVTAYHHLGVEFEVAVRVADDLPASGGPWTRASVAGRVAACLPAFELVEDGDADYKALDAFTLVAQNTWNGGVGLASPRSRGRGDPLLAQ